MRWKHPACRSLLLPAVLVIALMLAGCASAPPANVKMVQCYAKKIAWDVTPEAEIESFSCALGQHDNLPSLLFTVGVKNISDKAARFRVNIFLMDMDKANGHLVPAKGKPPVLEPGAEKTVKIPFIKTTALSQDILVRVLPVSIEE